MKQIRLVNAYKALAHLAVQTLPIKTAYAIHKLRRALAPAWEFQIAQEQALAEKYRGQIDGGSIRFGNANDPEAVERARAYAADMSELNGMESDYEAQPPVRVLLTDEIVISANEIDALDGFVEFTDGGDA